MENFPARKEGIFVGFLAIFFIIFLLFIFLEPSSSPQNILVSNISDHKAAISWTTKHETKGEIVISPDGKFPLLPLFVKTEKDDRDTKSNKVDRYTTHHIKFGQLLPNKSYGFRVYQGLRKVYEGNFKTASALSNIEGPNPVYGKVVNADRKTPAPGVIVYLKAGNSSILSTLTNSQGRWSLDLSNLRTNDLSQIYRLNSKSVEDLIVDSGSKGRFAAHALFGQDKPWSNIILKIKNQK